MVVAGDRYLAEDACDRIVVDYQPLPPVVRWDAADRSLRVYSSTQTSTSVRFALAAKLGVPVDRVEVVAPDVGGGFGVKIVHPWPEEVLVPWAAMRLGRE